MKAGRNDPCPCGSGKKYKKCCLEKDENDRNMELAAVDRHQSLFTEKEVDEWEPEAANPFSDWGDDPVDEYIDDSLDDSEFDEEELDDETVENEEDDEFKNAPESDKLPGISDEETQLVDEWWKAYKKMNDTVKEREHLMAFIDQYPHLTEHLELHWDALFDMGAAHFRQGIYETFFDLLVRIRNEFPNVYQKSYSYYDADIIYWLAAHNRLSEIDQYFSFFKENIEGGIDRITEIVNFLRALNHSDILLPLANSSYRRHVEPITIHRIISKYLDQGATEETARLLVDELHGNNMVLSTDDVKLWLDMLVLYQRPLVSWSNVLPGKRSEAMDYYYNIVENFTSYLYQNTDLSFDSAKCYTDTVFDYYQSIVNGNKRPVDVFGLDIPTFREHTKGSGWFNSWFISNVEDIIRMNAFYHYAGYLRKCGNITEEQKEKFQKYLSDTYAEHYPKVEKNGPEMLSFKQFPLFLIKE